MRAFISIGVLLGIAAGCGDRDPRWDQWLNGVEAFGLTDAVAVTDPTASRVVLLTTDATQHLRRTSVPTQRGLRTARVSPDHTKLFLISAGDGDQRPPAGEEAQSAALEVVTRASEGRRVYPLSEPFAGLALDPIGRWAVVYADSKSSALVRNPNELLLVDLASAPVEGGANANPRSLTLRSFGGQPQRFTFTPPLNLPGGMRRLLIVETEQDVAIVDLERPADAEITIQLTSGQDTRQLHPAGVAVDDGAPAATDDARIAIRLDNDRTVILAQLVPGTGRDFRPELNLVDVGGTASDAAFVHTDGGTLALAVLVPSRSKAVLIDPTTSLSTEVPLPAAYSRLSLVTTTATATAATAAVDVALLWNGSGGGVSFWELGRTAGQPYRAVQTLGVSSGVTGVKEVGGAHPELKILETNGAGFLLLDLKTREAAPFATSRGGIVLQPSATGDRAWAYAPQSTELSVVGMEQLHPQAMRVDRRIAQLFDIAAIDGDAPAGTRSLVAWHDLGNMGATVYDALANGATTPIDARRTYAGILTEVSE